MASNPPPFQVEDNTDEDFFDKLVNDDDDLDFNATAMRSTSVDPEFTDGNESDDAKAFANLSFNDLVNSSEVAKDAASSSNANEFDNLSMDVEHKVETLEKVGNPLVSVGSFEFDNFSHIHENGNDLPNVELASKISVVGLSDTSMASQSDIGSGAPAVKQVDWSAFHSDSVQSAGNGFGSYSDFFSELEVADAADPFESLVANDLSNGPQVASVSDVHESAFVESSSNTVQYNEDHNYVTTANQSSDIQDLSSIQQWEDMYPGWKFDPITGQWYQVEGHDAATSDLANVEADVSSTWGVAEKQTEVSYLQQGAHSVAGIVTENDTTESIMSLNQASQTNNASETTAYWNQVPQVADDKNAVQSDWNQAATQNNDYPPNMVFDPQYPDYYYDTISQEWKSLESYTASIGSSTRVQGQPNGNEVTHTDSYSQYSGKKDNNQELYNTYAQDNNYIPQSQDQNWGDSKNNYTQQRPGMWRPDPVTSAAPMSQYNETHLVESQYVQTIPPSIHGSQQTSVHYSEAVPHYQNAAYVPTTFTTPSQHQSFNVNGRYSQQFNDVRANQHGQSHASYDYYNNQNAASFSNQVIQNSQASYDPAHGRSSAGRPAHALVAFGFGGKLVVMKYRGSENLSFGNQKPEGNSVSVLNLMEIVNEKIDASDHGMGVCNYFQALGRQSVPGPLTGGSVSTKELNKWIDDRIAKPEPAGLDYREAGSLRMLLSLLKISCQYYGKLRSPYGADAALKDNDAPESALAKLFASAKNNNGQFNQYGAAGQCLKQIPSEGQMQATAAEVQSLLVSGRKREAIECAQEGQLWGPALVLAAQLGDQFYIDTVKKMALRQLVAGSPLRTLCLLIAGQPAEVFSADTLSSSMPGVPQQQSKFGANCLLDDWEENLAVITANRTKDDQSVLTNLGDELWKADNINAAHICYLVGEVSFDPFSDAARFCLVGANHWKYPRSYAGPEAIQMTEIYEYSKTLANSQFVLLPFQPYKLVYAHMLAEVGRVSEALKYSQALLRSLKIGRTPEVENLRNLASSLEERIKAHQQGGFSTNLDPKKIVHKIRNLFVGGGLPPTVPTPGGTMQSNDNYYQPIGPRVSSSQSTLAMSSLVSPSMEPMNDANASDRFVKHSRSVSEPDFLRSPRQGQTEASSTNTEGKASATSTTSRFRSFGFGSQFLQKTVGLVLKRNDRQAKLGEQNKFYYDEKLKRWVEEGAAAPAEEAVLPPPPTTAVFQNGTSDYNFKSALQTQASHSNGSPEFKMASSPESNTGMPPLPPTSNQFSARGRAGGLGARSRYVDTFHKNSAPTANLFHSPPAPSFKPATGSNPKFFVPAASPVSSNTEQPTDTSNDNTQETSTTYQNSPSNSFQSSPPPSSIPMQRFASMNNIKGPPNETGSFSVNSRRTASWSGSSFNNSFSPPHRGEVKPLAEQMGVDPSLYMQSDPSLGHSSSYGDDLHEVEL